MYFSLEKETAAVTAVRLMAGDIPHGSGREHHHHDHTAGTSSPEEKATVNLVDWFAGKQPYKAVSKNSHHEDSHHKNSSGHHRDKAHQEERRSEPSPQEEDNTQAPTRRQTQRAFDRWDGLRRRFASKRLRDNVGDNTSGGRRT
ncbi:hypothetical protein VM1G_11794 [Cytospora mali]|uniref:Uncharacterized protein n=1 Tax=Cytospora mali TaxID=578113 RepID=A0A194W886_CYTMA|nr:hypothetical protein VM1G_11794 [Valsa mali]